MFFGCDRLGPAAWTEASRLGGNFLENAGADAACDAGDLFHVGAGLCNAILRLGCCIGLGFHPHRPVLSFFRDLPGMAGGCPYGQRHLGQCALWQPAEDYISASILFSCAPPIALAESWEKWWMLSQSR